MTDHDKSGVAFCYARGKLALYLLGGLAFAIACGWAIYIDAAPSGSFDQAVLWFGVPFFGLLVLLALKNFGDRRAILTISSEGIRDVRIAPNLIPWDAIRGMTLREIKRQRFVMLDLDPGFEKTLQLTRLARFSKPMNAAIGFHGHALNPAGLNGSLDQIVGAIEKFSPGAGVSR
ncbi:MAG: STM3941 family protein [Hyphomicrobium sp.]